jgi:PadR family transcriptional regulator, regulatory protein PadR
MLKATTIRWSGDFWSSPVDSVVRPEQPDSPVAPCEAGQSSTQQRLHGHLYLCSIQSMKVTNALVQVAVALMAEPFSEQYGYPLLKAAHVRSGVLYPILGRMMNEGWLTDGWEDPAIAQAEKRPSRRFYKITDHGFRELGMILDNARIDARFAGTFRLAT